MFRRQAPRNLRERLARLWPKKGWLRSLSYMLYRLRRLPDTPHRIARGVAAGIFASFTPLYGLHFILAGTIAWGIGGNIVAAMIGTAVGNPLTFPFIAALSVELGQRILDQPGHMPPGQILAAFTRATVQLSENFAALFGAGQMEWARLSLFFQRVFLPYLVGGIVPGLIAAVIGHVLTLRLVLAYQKLRDRRRTARIEKRRAALRSGPEGAPGAGASERAAEGGREKTPEEGRSGEGG